MEVSKTLERYKHTRRVSGRRAITPIKSRHRKIIKKTRGHKVEKKPYVSILKHTVSHSDGGWKEKDKDEHGENSQWQGDQNSDGKGGEENTQEYAQVEQSRNTENSEKSIHPGPIQTLSHVSELITAYDQTCDKTEIESELLQ